MIRTKHLVLSIFGVAVLMTGGFVGTHDFKAPYPLSFNIEKVTFTEPQELYAVEIVQEYRDVLERNRFIERVRATLPANALIGSSESGESEETPITENSTEPVVEEVVVPISDPTYTTTNVATPAPFPIATFTSTTTGSTTPLQESSESQKEVASSTEPYGNTGF